MISALWNGISGLSTFEKAINVESNNATNVNTVGYKEDVVTFEDMMYQNRYGKGVNVENVTKAMPQQGGIKLTSNPSNSTTLRFKKHSSNSTPSISVNKSILKGGLPN